MNAIDRLKLRLKILASLPRDPTDEQLGSIIKEIDRIGARRTPTEQDWKAITTKYVPGAGTGKYAGEDTSDLNGLLDAIRTKPSGGNTP